MAKAWRSRAAVAVTAIAAVAGATRVAAQQISAARYHGFAVRAGDKEAVGWGKDGSYEKLSSRPDGEQWALVSAAESYSCGVTTSGAAHCWGGVVSVSAAVPNGKTWSQISSGSNHACGVTSTDEGVCWGGNDSGQVSSMPTGKQWIKISAGTSYSCGIAVGGNASCWGYNAFGKLNVPPGKNWGASCPSPRVQTLNATYQLTQLDALQNDRRH